MSASDNIPLLLRGNTIEELLKKLRMVQARLYGSVHIISIQQDIKEKDWVCIYFPPRGGAGLM